MDMESPDIGNYGDTYTPILLTAVIGSLHMNEYSIQHASEWLLLSQCFEKYNISGPEKY